MPGIILVYQAFFLDAFSANRVFDFAETLSFCLEFWVFSLSYWVFFLNLLKSSQFPLKNWLFLPYFSLKWGILAIFQPLQCISPLFGSIFVVIFSNFAETLSFLLEFWVIFLRLEFSRPWVFFKRSKKKPALQLQIKKTDTLNLHNLPTIWHFCNNFSLPRF